jgi:small subunit ribosomal protein S4e
MGRHGERKVLKRLNTPKYLQIKRKHGKYFVRPIAGPHPSRLSLPLLHIVRDLLKIADNYQEAKKLITRGYFKVDGKVVKNIKFPIGLMDVLTIEKMNKSYRILPSSFHQFVLHEISGEEANYKLCRIKNKKWIKGGQLQLNLHDGRNLLINVQDPRNPKEDSYKVMDVLKISVPDQAILKTIRFKTGSLAIITAGIKKDIGNVGRITNILKRFGPFASTFAIKQESGYETEGLYDYAFVIGEDQSEISLPTRSN